MENIKKISFQPKEEMLRVKTKNKKVSIGIPKECSFQEKRIALLPSEVEFLVENGYEVFVERGLSEALDISDNQYSEKGAYVCDAVTDVFSADIITKVAPLTHDELDLVKDNQIVISALHLIGQDEHYFRRLMEKKVTAIAYEYICDEDHNYPLLDLIDEIVGNTVVMLAAEYLSFSKTGKAKLLGGIAGINPSRIIVFGAGVISEQIAKIGSSMGAIVKVFDNDMAKLKKLKNKVGLPIYTNIMRRKDIETAFASADVVVAAMQIDNGKQTCIIDEEMMKLLPQGCVVIDTNIDHGGIFCSSRMTTHKDPYYIENDCIHYCVPNIASRVPYTASMLMSTYYSTVIQDIGEMGVNHLLHKRIDLRNGVYLFNGIVCKKNIAEMMHLPFKDINMLIAAFNVF